MTHHRGGGWQAPCLTVCKRNWGHHEAMNASSIWVPASSDKILASSESLGQLQLTDH